MKNSKAYYAMSRRWQNLEEMCQIGSDAVKDGHYDALKFDLYNEQECEEIKAIMSSKYPDIKFSTTHYKFTTPDNASKTDAPK